MLRLQMLRFTRVFSALARCAQGQPGGGGDKDTATEGIAWILQRLATDHPTTTADVTPPGLSGWASVAVNGTEYGLYTNLEQKDESFLQHRGVFDATATWLYKVEELQFSPLGVDSPTQTALCYPPFGSTCATPDNATLETQLEALIDMDVMLTQGAVEMYIVAPDNFFSKNVNYWHVDWEAPVNLKRRYLADNLHTVLTNSSANIYGADQSGGPSEIQTIILGHPTFGPRFELAMCNLLAGPFQAAALTQMVTDVETTIRADFIADPNNNIGSDPEDVDAHFNGLRQYMVDRIASINSQLSCPTPPAVPAMSNRGQVVLVVLLFMLAGVLIVSFRREGANLNS